LEGFEPDPVIEQLKSVASESLPLPPENPSQFRSYDRCWLYCLPADTARVKDRLYEEEYVKVKYKDPFRFQGAVIRNSDIRMHFWTTVEHVTSRSIVFQPDARRWWEVQAAHIDRNKDGTIYSCVPSKVTPDFSSLTPA
jgi:hypothetical protein